MGADEERTVMRTHSPAYRDQTMYFQPGNGTASEALASSASSIFARSNREVDFRPLNQPRTDENIGERRQISVAVLGHDAALHDALRLDRGDEIEVAKFSSAGDLVAAFRRGEASDVVLLDSNVGSGAADLLRELNMSGLRIPIAMLLDGHKDATETFDARDARGSRGQLLDHVRLVADLLRAEPSVEKAPATPANLRLDTKTCQAFWKGSPVHLTITEFNIVSLFARRAGENLSYREIYDVVHGAGFCAGDGVNGYQTNVRSLIKRIRQKFHDVDEGFDDIENHRGYGYRWRLVEAIEDHTQPLRHEVPQLETARATAMPQAAVLTGAALTLVMVVCLANSAAG